MNGNKKTAEKAVLSGLNGSNGPGMPAGGLVRPGVVTFYCMGNQTASSALKRLFGFV
jgi:hypothetical protein